MQGQRTPSCCYYREPLERPFVADVASWRVASEYQSALQIEEFQYRLCAFFSFALLFNLTLHSPHSP